MARAAALLDALWQPRASTSTTWFFSRTGMVKFISYTTECPLHSFYLLSSIMFELFKSQIGC